MLRLLDRRAVRLLDELPRLLEAGEDGVEVGGLALAQAERAELRSTWLRRQLASVSVIA